LGQISHKIAQLSLDFPRIASMCGGAQGSCAMDANTVEIAIKAYLAEMRQRLDEAASIAKAAQACAESGNIEKGVEIALDVEQLVYEAETLLNAASLINRISKG
jgi:hypothetical protein